MWYFLTAAALAALTARAAVLRTEGLRHGSSAKTGAVRAVQREGRVHYDLDLESFKLSAHQGSSRWGAYLVNASFNNTEVACLSCSPDLFAGWVAQLKEGLAQQKEGATRKKAAAKKDVGVVDADKEGKHPGSPGYEEWVKQQKARKGASFLASSALAEPGLENISITNLDDLQLEAIKPRLQTMWMERRLVIGHSEHPMHERMDFGEALESLARESPALTAPDCERQGLPYCNSLFSGSRTASGSELRRALDKTFGAIFLKQHAHVEGRSVEEERNSVRALLSALKSNFSFYYQKCLAHEQGSESCDTGENSELVGQIACKPEDDEPSDDCVYAELRRCPECGAQPRFFEYSRFHGPLALFETKLSRNRVMGQCEEFSRAGHAMLAALGYEARYVLDFTDHVWIEVRLPNGEGGTWVHADPSEGVLDQPLMYEEGWGKRLTMIFAFTPNYVEHITHKYTADYNKTIWRRGISEQGLTEVVKEVNQHLRYELPKRTWGFHHSTSRGMENLALWSHFEGASHT